jgi:hypothetical protein
MKRQRKMQRVIMCAMLPIGQCVFVHLALALEEGPDRHPALDSVCGRLGRFPDCRLACVRMQQLERLLRDAVFATVSAFQCRIVVLGRRWRGDAAGWFAFRVVRLKRRFRGFGLGWRWRGICEGRAGYWVGAQGPAEASWRLDGVTQVPSGPLDGRR